MVMWPICISGQMTNPWKVQIKYTKKVYLKYNWWPPKCLSPRKVQIKYNGAVEKMSESEKVYFKYISWGPKKVSPRKVQIKYRKVQIKYLMMGKIFGVKEKYK